MASRSREFSFDEYIYNEEREFLLKEVFGTAGKERQYP